MTISSLEGVLTKLLEKAYERGKRSVVWGQDEKQVGYLSELLWTYSESSFLPHGASVDSLPIFSEEHPVWLTTTLENPNKSTFLFIINERQATNQFSFSRIFDLFDGCNTGSCSAANRRLGYYREQGCNIICWKQKQTGTWIKLPSCFVSCGA